MLIPVKQEGPIEGYLASFQFYDSKHRRISAFARTVDVPVGDTNFSNGEPAQTVKMLEVTCLTLSDTPTIREHYTQRGKKKVLASVELLRDTFTRKAGRKKYEEECLAVADTKLWPGNRTVMEIIDNRPRYTFLTWLNEKYYRAVAEQKTINVTKFVRGKNYVHKKKKNAESKSEEIGGSGSAA